MSDESPILKVDKTKSPFFRSIWDAFRVRNKSDGGTDPFLVPWDKNNREIRMLQASNFFNEGAKFDFHSSLSPNFSTTHTFMWGSDPQNSLYCFSAFYSGKRIFCHGQVDSQRSVQIQGDYYWKPMPDPPTDPTIAAQSHNPFGNPNVSATRIRAHLLNEQERQLIQLEHEHVGRDYIANVRVINPSLTKPPSSEYNKESKDDRLALGGIFSFSICKALTKSLSAGFEYIHQRLSTDISENVTSYAIRYATVPSKPYSIPSAIPEGIPSPFPKISKDVPMDVFMLLFTPVSGILYSTYTKRINQRLDVFSELKVPLVKVPAYAHDDCASCACVGLKLDTLHSTIRAMIESNYNITTTVDEKIFPGLTIQLSAKMDYSNGSKCAGRMGFGFSFES